MNIITLPWNEQVDVFQIVDIVDILKSDSRVQQDLIPYKILVLADFDIKPEEIDKFLLDFVEEFILAQIKWLQSISYLSMKGLFSNQDMSTLVGKNYGEQIQVIHLTYNNKLSAPHAHYCPLSDSNVLLAGESKAFGIYQTKFDNLILKPKSSASILAINPLLNTNWDFVCAHESAHLLFSPLSILVEDLCYDSSWYGKYQFGKVNEISELSANDLAKIYLGMNEFIVSGMNQQAVQTANKPKQTGLPVFETIREVKNFLRFAIELFPDMGFEDAKQIVEDHGYYFNKKQNDLTITELATPCLRVFCQSDCYANSPDFMPFFANSYEEKNNVELSMLQY
jgi:hypothetical protein